MFVLAFESNDDAAACLSHLRDIGVVIVQGGQQVRGRDARSHRGLNVHTSNTLASTPRGLRCAACTYPLLAPPHSPILCARHLV